MKEYYSVMLDIENRPCVVIGGGLVAERKISSLLKSKADITVISPEATTYIKDLAKDGKLHWLKREFQVGDLRGYFMVIIATNDSLLNQKIHQEANLKTQLVNLVDQPEQSNFIVPASIKRGGLQIAISTSGASPGLAKKIRFELERQYGVEYEQYMDFLWQMRQWIIKNVSDEKNKRDFFQLILEPSYFVEIKAGKQDLVQLTIQELKKLIDNKDKRRD